MYKRQVPGRLVLLGDIRHALGGPVEPLLLTLFGAEHLDHADPRKYVVQQRIDLSLIHI